MKTKSQLLCPVSEWEEHEVERGKSTGKILKTRHVIAADTFNWILALENAGKPGVYSPVAYFGSMKSLMPCLMYLKNFETSANNIIAALVDKTGKTFELTLAAGNDNPFKDPSALGTWIDDNYQTSFFNPYPPTVYQNIFKALPEQESE